MPLPSRVFVGARAHKNTHTHREKYEILIAFPQQQWLHECASLLRYTHVARLVDNCYNA